MTLIISAFDWAAGENIINKDTAEGKTGLFGNGTGEVSFKQFIDRIRELHRLTGFSNQFFNKIRFILDQIKGNNSSLNSGHLHQLLNL